VEPSRTDETFHEASSCHRGGKASTAPSDLYKMYLQSD
jgi:hypothetical protein